jgi:hypothetical protein
MLTLCKIGDKLGNCRRSRRNARKYFQVRISRRSNAHGKAPQNQQDWKQAGAERDAAALLYQHPAWRRFSASPSHSDEKMHSVDADARAPKNEAVPSENRRDDPPANKPAGRRGAFMWEGIRVVCCQPAMGQTD